MYLTASAPCAVRISWALASRSGDFTRTNNTNSPTRSGKSISGRARAAAAARSSSDASDDGAATSAASATPPTSARYGHGKGAYAAPANIRIRSHAGRVSHLRPKNGRRGMAGISGVPLPDVYPELLAHRLATGHCELGAIEPDTSNSATVASSASLTGKSGDLRSSRARLRYRSIDHISSRPDWRGGDRMAPRIGDDGEARAAASAERSSMRCPRKSAAA